MTHRAPDKECSGWETNYLTVVVVFEHVTRTYTYNVHVRAAAISADEPGSSGQVGSWPTTDQRTRGVQEAAQAHGKHVNLENWQVAKRAAVWNCNVHLWDLEG